MNFEELLKESKECTGLMNECCYRDKMALDIVDCKAENCKYINGKTPHAGDENK